MDIHSDATRRTETIVIDDTDVAVLPDDLDDVQAAPRLTEDDWRRLLLGDAPPETEKIFDPNQPRDEIGRWAETGAGGDDSLAANPPKLADLFERLLNPDIGGFTVHAVTGVEPTGPGHYAVSIFKGRETVIPLDQLKLKDIHKFLQGNRTLLSQPNNYFGGWVDQGQVYFDVSRVVRSAEEAATLAKAHKQKAYWDFGAFTGVNVEGKEKRARARRSAILADTTGGTAHGRTQSPRSPSKRRRRDAICADGRAVQEADEARTDARRQERRAGRSGPRADRRVKAADPPSIRLAIERAVDLARDLVREFESFGDWLAVERLTAAIQSGNLQKINEVINWAVLGERIELSVRPELRASYLSGVEAVERSGERAQLPEDLANRPATPAERPAERPAEQERRPPERGRVNLRFDMKNERAIEYASTQSAQLITEVTDDQKEWVRDLITRAKSEGRTAQETARDLTERIGLHSRQVNARDRYERELRAQGMDEDKIARLVGRYSESLLRQRGEMIARTELLRASNEGKLATLRNGVQNGRLPADRTFRRWVITDDERICTEYCLPMSEEDVGLVPWDQPWILPDGTEVFIPTEAHPNCRCTFSTVILGRREAEEAHALRVEAELDEEES